VSSKTTTVDDVWKWKEKTSSLPHLLILGGKADLREMMTNASSSANNTVKWSGGGVRSAGMTDDTSDDMRERNRQQKRSSLLHFGIVIKLSC